VVEIVIFCKHIGGVVGLGTDSVGTGMGMG